jgi:hypothetical protein
MTPAPFERAPASSEREDFGKKEAWLDNPSLLERARADVGDVIKEMQRTGDSEVYARLPLSDGEMQGLARMYLKGIEDGESLEVLNAQIEEFVRRKRAKRAA